MKQIELDFVIIVVGAVVVDVRHPHHQQHSYHFSLRQLPELNAALKISARIFT